MEDKHATMHWAYQAAKKTIAEHGEQELFTVASGITPSGVIHIGNFRESITVDLIKRAFRYLGCNVRHIHSWDDNDVFRKVPKGIPQPEMLKENLRKCIVDVPDPFNETKSYADKHIKDVEDALPLVGINPKYIRQSIKYRNGDYANDIKFALEHKDEIKKILDNYRKEPLDDDWLPISIFCPACLKDTITSISYDGDYTVSYECACNHKETIDFRETGIVKLAWRVDWPMRWHYENVHFEPGGKDHSTVGGSYDTGKQISETIWKKKAPSYLMYDFVRIKGLGGKISSSSGNVITLKDCLKIYEPEIIRYLFAGTRPGSEFAISFDTDVLKVYEDYDKCERIYYKTQDASEQEFAKQKLIYEFSQVDENLENIPKEQPVQITFRHISTILQIKSLDINQTLDFFKDEIKNDTDRKKLLTRITCVKNWLELYADEQFKFAVRDEKDEDFISTLSDQEQKALLMLKTAVEQNHDEESLSTAIFAVPKELDMNMKEFFTLSYKAIIGKDRGPKLASFILEIGNDKVARLL
jgi:lysyl-tRNA synthetase class 1